MDNGTPNQPPPTVVAMSPTIGQWVAAMAKAQRKIQNPERNRKVTVRTKAGATYEFAYATLDAILDHARPILAENEIVVLGGTRSGQGWVEVSTMLAHSSGEWMENSIRVAVAAGIQELGGQITYLRRYTLCSLLGIAAEEDDDANAAAGNSATPKRQETDVPRDTKVERDPIPAGIPAWQGRIVNIKAKGGTNKQTGKEWTKYTLVGADGEEFDTFSASAKQVVVDGGKEIEYQITYEETKFGKTIQEIRPLADQDGEIPF